VFRTKEKGKPTSFTKLFDNFLDANGLLIDPQTEQKRVFYSLRNTYATLALTHDNVPIHTLAKQMGTSVGMIEKHYSHLDRIGSEGLIMTWPSTASGRFSTTSTQDQQQYEEHA
jgi:integrase